MAQIREYNSTQVFSADPLQTAARRQEVLGIEAGGELKAGFESVSQGIRQAEEHIAQTETSKAAADLATTHANLSVQWNDLVAHADPNDHELANRFIEQNVKPAFDKIGQSLITQQGQDYFQRASASAHGELLTKTAADQARLAGEAAVTNLDTFKNQQSNMARADPTTLGHVLENSSDDNLAQLYPNIPRSQITELGRSIRSEAAKSAAYGAIDQDAPSAKMALERGDLNDHLDGTTIQTLVGRANEQIRANAAAGRAADAEQRRVERETAEKFSTQVTTSLISPDGTERVPPDYFSNVMKYGQLPGAEPGRAEALISAGERILNNVDTKDAPGLVAAFMDRLTTGNPPTQNEVLSHVGRDLKQASANFIMEHMKPTPTNQMETQFVNSILAEAKQVFGLNHQSNIGILDEYAQRNYGRFEDWFRLEVQNRKQNGQDPMKFLNRNDDAYLLKGPLPFQKFVGKPSDTVRTMLNQTAPPPPAATGTKRPSLDDIFGR